MPEFLFGTELKPDAATPKFGIVPLIWGTFMIAAGSSMIALPIGLLSAIYLSEYAPAGAGCAQADPRVAGRDPDDCLWIRGTAAGHTRAQGGSWNRWVLRVETFNALAACIVVGVMIIPLVSSLSEDVLSAVPRGLREAAYGLGATKFEVSTRIVLPAGLSGVFASFILAISRAVGETMAVVLAAGMRPQITLNPLTSIETMTTYIVQVISGDASYGEPEISVVVRGRPDALRGHAHVEHHLRLGIAAVSGGLPLSLSEEPRFQPNRWMRRILGPIFGAACLAATCMGVVVLALLLGSILYAGPPGAAQ